MKIFFLFLGLFIQTALACEVNLPHHVVVFNDDSSGKSVLQSKNCSPEALDQLHQMLAGLEGRVASYQLTEMMTAKQYEVKIQPASILVQQFRSVIKDQIPLPSGVHVKSARPVNFPAILALNAGDRLQVSCSACLFGSQQPINVSVLAFDGNERTLMANADFKKLVKAYRLISPHASFSTIENQSVLKEEYIEAIPHTDLLTELDTLKFYKTNKPLRAGEYLRKSDLNAVNLVKAGLKTEVVLENQMVRIKTSGISRSNGSIGELVEVFHPQKNKKYQGRVIDINKVLVEL